MSEYFGEKHGLGLTSLATPLILGTRDHMHIEDLELKEEIDKLKTTHDYMERNIHSRSEFVIDGTENPHPRFPGLMQSIRERRGEKVRILVPIYQDKNTSYSADLSSDISKKLRV